MIQKFNTLRSCLQKGTINFFVGVLILTSAYDVHGKPGNNGHLSIPDTVNKPNNVTSLLSEHSKAKLLLSINNVDSVAGNFTKIASHFVLKDECKLIWNVDIKESADYTVVLSYSSIEIVNIRYNSKKINNREELLTPTSGIYNEQKEWYQFNCIRKRLESKLTLKKGSQKIIFSITPSPNDKNFVFKSVELISSSAKKGSIQELERIKVERADTKWFRSIPYGLMFHWTSESAPQKGDPKPFKEAVQEFDVVKFANMANETGAGYVIFTVGHAEAYCPAPLKSWEKYHPGMTTQRDLIMELADELFKQNIKLICYLPTHVVAKYKKVNEVEFMKINSDILLELGERYKEKIAGYWFDGWYQCFEEYPGVSFEAFFKAAKTGNNDRLIALNSWLYPIITPWQDYWAGETFSGIVPPVSNIIKEGPGEGLPFHALLALEGDWVYARSIYKNDMEIPPPILDSSYLINLISSCKGIGPITLNVLIRQDGSISNQSMNVLKTLKEKFLKKK
jgi:hypothetical protein